MAHNLRTKAGREAAQHELEARRMQALRLRIPPCAAMTGSQLRLIIQRIGSPATVIEVAEALATDGIHESFE
jgi:hypothetical protein